jgi:hypothetical protein
MRNKLTLLKDGSLGDANRCARYLLKKKQVEHQGRQRCSRVDARQRRCEAIAIFGRLFPSMSRR